MKPIRLASALLFILSCLPVYCLADLPDYGVVVGTVVYDNISDIALTKSPHLEPQQTEGKYPHYMFYVDSPSGRYQCVIDIFSRKNTSSDKESIRYRVVPLGIGTQEWSSTLSLANGYHQLATDADHGALDYARHPAINKDARTLTWKWDANFVVGEKLPTFDNLFKGVKRVWVFGQPYTSGLGLHNIHQNQGNVPNSVLQAPQGPDGEDHSAANGIWQDGGVILEYAPTKRWIPPLCKVGVPCKKKGHWLKVPNRKLLMTQFQVQEDFTLDTNATIDNYNLKAGDGYPPLYLYDFRITGGPTTISAGAPPMEGQHSNSSGISKKIQILVTPVSGHPVLYGRIGAPPTKQIYDAKSDQPIGGSPETIHSYSASPQHWYWRVFNVGTTPAEFTWEEFEDNH
jgi:hypothetical protein